MLHDEPAGVHGRRIAAVPAFGRSPDECAVIDVVGAGDVVALVASSIR